jgi:hypothetical protein
MGIQQRIYSEITSTKVLIILLKVQGLFALSSVLLPLYV